MLALLLLHCIHFTHLVTSNLAARNINYNVANTCVCFHHLCMRFYKLSTHFPKFDLLLMLLNSSSSELESDSESGGSVRRSR